MALTGKLVADFASFYDAVNKAQVELKSFQGDANKVGDSLNRMANSFSGKTVIQQATLMVEAVEKIGGAAKLTDKEFGRLQSTVTEAVNKMRALGIDVPDKMRAIADATQKTVEPAHQSATAFSKMGVAVGTFLGNFAANLLQQGISSLVNLATSAVATAGKIDDLSKKLGISAEAVQGFQYAAEQSGTTIDTFGAAINKLNINLAEGDKRTVAALDALGLEFADLRAAGGEEALLRIADAVAKIPNPMERARLMTELMGKSAIELLPAVQDGLRKTAEGAAKMSDETVARLAAAEDAWAKLAAKVTILSGETIAGVIGKYEDLARRMARIPTDAKTAMEAAAHNMEAAMEGVSEVGGVKFTRQVTGNIDDLLDARLALDALPPVKPLVDEAQLTRQSTALGKAATAQQKWNETRARERQAIEAASQGMTHWIAGMETAPKAISSIDDSLSSDLIPAVQLSQKAVMAFATQGQDGIFKFTKTLVSQNASSVASLATVRRAWDVLARSTEDAMRGLGASTAQTFGEMLVGLRGFHDGWVDIWNSIRQAFANILADMLNDFIQGFLDKMIAEMAGRFAGGAAGGGSSGGLGGLLGGLVAKWLGIGSGGAAAGGGAAGGGAAGGGAAGGGGGAAGAGAGGAGGAAVVGGAAAAILLAWGISEKGWFRGGEEGIRVNPFRDAIFKQAVDRYGGTPYEAMVKALADQGIVGQQASDLIGNLYAAKTMDEFRRAYTPIIASGAYRPRTAAETYQAAHPEWQPPPTTQTNTTNIAAGAIVIQGTDKTPTEIARELAPALVDVIVRENPDGARTRLAYGLA